jgi:alkanesulfonate monooxygenase SsuD/methylene tetrahydromethanopterin reductase-like flavin-dependent oxidoreductase (luciferase family)
VIGPQPITPGGPPILIGGFAPPAVARVARHGDGFLCAAPLQWARPLVTAVQEQRTAAGRIGNPHLVCQINVAIGAPSTIDAARTAIANYYAFTGRPGWGAPLSDFKQIAEAVDAYREFGADELVLYCYAPDANQVELLSELLP